jgi:glyoxylase-like metal-dependent hydrolase (beta-lactamase superfamily II)
MDMPTPVEPRLVADDTHILTTLLPAPGLGILPANAFVIRAAEPVVIDAGVSALAGAAFEQVCSVIDPADVRWIYLTHTDPDHTGCLDALLAAAPRARIVTTYLGMGKLGLSRQIAPERFYLLNPGQSLDLGDRQLLAIRPPVYDAPETTGVFDGKTRALFSADCFGGVLGGPADAARAVPAASLRDGIVTWSGVDAPWLAATDAASFERSLTAVTDLGPRLVLSSHLPPAWDMMPALLDALRSARVAPSFVGPDQAALEQMAAA